MMAETIDNEVRWYGLVQPCYLLRNLLRLSSKYKSTIYYYLISMLYCVTAAIIPYVIIKFRLKSLKFISLSGLLTTV